MIKLQDFAKQKGITDRQVQRQLKKYETDLEGHFERKGCNGTWLDDFACSFLENKMIQSPVIAGGGELLQKNAELQLENETLRKEIHDLQTKLLAAKDAIIDLSGAQARLEAAEQSYQLLEQSCESYKADLEQTNSRVQELQTELNQFKPTFFGLYKKQG